MCAHCTDRKVFDAVLSGDKVCYIAIKALHKIVVFGFVVLHPSGKLYRVTVLIATNLCTTSATLADWDEVQNIAAQ